MSLKLAPTDVISVELIFKDYVTFKEKVVYLTEEVPENVAMFFDEILLDFALIIVFLEKFIPYY